jgi:hypothetical protein
MSIFGMIKDAIFGSVGSAQAQVQSAQQGGDPQAMPQMGTAPAGAGGQGVDVEQVLNQRAQQKGNPDLNWRSSIVDLMKLLDLDSSLDNRKALATELGYTGAKDGSAEMNIWLHRRVMSELARNGGVVPASMTD